MRERKNDNWNGSTKPQTTAKKGRGPEGGDDVQPLLVSVDDVGRLLSVSARTVWRLDSAGKLPKAVRVGGQKRWRRDELIAWVADGCPNRKDWQSRLVELDWPIGGGGDR